VKEPDLISEHTISLDEKEHQISEQHAQFGGYVAPTGNEPGKVDYRAVLKSRRNIFQNSDKEKDDKPKLARQQEKEREETKRREQEEKEAAEAENSRTIELELETAIAFQITEEIEPVIEVGLDSPLVVIEEEIVITIDQAPPPPLKTAQVAPAPTEFHSLEYLKTHPDNLDLKNLETYLSPEDFMKVFQMTKEEFVKKPLWKKTLLKKEAGIF